MGARLVAHPVFIGVPERARLEDDDAPASACESLRQDGSACAGPDDDHVHDVVIIVATHRGLARQVTTMDVDEESGIIRSGATCTFEPAEHDQDSSPAKATGSSSVAPGFSYGSSTASGPSRM